MKEFLIRAKRATYAGKGAEAEPSRPRSHDLRYCEGDTLYIDTYIGGPKFAGEEAVWVGGKPAWAMNYVGRVIGEGFSWDFLKEALYNPPKETPFRGPSVYESGGYRYICNAEGSFDWFTGSENISLDGVIVYECRFHGGMIE